jgi:hypothetical protein
MDFDIRVAGQQLAGDLYALIQRKQGLLFATIGNSDDHAPEQAGGAAHEVFVSARQRIEGSRIYGHAIIHACSSK